MRRNKKTCSKFQSIWEFEMMHFLILHLMESFKMFCTKFQFAIYQYLSVNHNTKLKRDYIFKTQTKTRIFCYSKFSLLQWCSFNVFQGHFNFAYKQEYNGGRCSQHVNHRCRRIIAQKAKKNVPSENLKKPPFIFRNLQHFRLPKNLWNFVYCYK